MKKLLIINPWTGRIGPNTFLVGLVEQNLLRGDKVCVLYPSPDTVSEELKKMGCDFIFFRKLKLIHINNLFLKLSSRLINEVCLFLFLKSLKKEYDLYVVNSEIFSFAIGALPKRSGKYVIVHSLSFLKSALSRGIFSIQSKYVTKYIAVSESVRQGLIKMGVVLPIATVYNGIDSDYYHRKHKGGADQSNKHVQFLCVIHPVPHKGAHILVKVLELVNRRDPNFQCFVLGWDRSKNVEYANQIDKSVELRQLDHKMFFLDNLEDLRPYYQNANIFIHPSESESFGYVIAEAMAFELPVVAFKVGGMIEVIRDKNTGILIDPYNIEMMADAIIQLMKSSELRKEYGRNGRERVIQEFDLKANVNKLIDLLV